MLRTHASCLTLALIFAVLCGLCTAGLPVLAEQSEQQFRKAKGVSRTSSSGGKTGGASGGGKARFSTPKTYTASNFNQNPPTYSATPRIRPYYLVLLLGVGAASRSNYHRQCPDGSFRFGSNCRPCSDWTCPIGQYRVECSPHNDAHCTACTNKPEGNTQYTEPGNNNDCAWEECDGPCPSISTNDEAVVALDILIPVDDAGFPAVEEEVKEGIATAGQVPSTSIIFAERVERTHTATRQTIAGGGGGEGLPDPRAQRRLMEDVNGTDSGITTNLTMDDVNLTSIEQWSCSVAIPDHDKYLQVAVEITVTEDQVGALWDLLTAFAVAEEMAERCLPPALLTYQTAPTTSAANRVGGTGLLLGLVLALFTSWW